MIPNSLFSSFYVVTIEGEYARSLFAPNHNIESVKVVSTKLENDFVAQAKANDVIEHLKKDLTSFDEEVKYNDLFTPKAPEMVWASLNRRKNAEPFDDLGDLVIFKSTLNLDNGLVSVKVLADPDEADALVSNYSKMQNVPQMPNVASHSRSFH